MTAKGDELRRKNGEEWYEHHVAYMKRRDKAVDDKIAELMKDPRFRRCRGMKGERE